jgi:hypothetical protein
LWYNRGRAYSAEIAVRLGESVLMQDSEVHEPEPSVGPYLLQLDLPLPLTVAEERPSVPCRDALRTLLAKQHPLEACPNECSHPTC